MSNEKIKTENYSNYGGINTKQSPYLTTPMEFLDLVNFSFQTPGSLTQRWGSTQYMGQGFSAPITSIFEYSKLSGASYVMVGHSGGLWAGATTGQAQGISLLAGTTTYTPGRAGAFTDILWNALSVGLVVQYQNAPYLGNINQQFELGGISTTISGQSLSSNKFSFAILNDYLFAASGDNFFKYNGTTTSFVGLPPVQPLISAFSTTVVNKTAATLIGIGVSVGTGFVGFYGSYVNDRGFEGQIWPIAAVNACNVHAATLGGSLIQVVVGLPVPPQFNIQSVNIYTYYSASVTLSTGSTAFWNYPYGFQCNIPISSMGVTTDSSDYGISVPVRYFTLGSTTGGLSSLKTNTGAFPDTNVNTYYPLGLTLIFGPGSVASNQIEGLKVLNNNPQYVEAYKNQLFLAGFSSTPSTVWFSDVGEPEGYPIDNNFEVRTNDGDVITSLKAYSTRLYVFKRNSFHCLYGDNSTNFYLQEVSTIYGCLNNRCAIIYENLLAFLDRKGVVIYNGANIQVLSNKVQSYFDRMNYSAAIDTAIMAHDKLRNQIMVAIPIDGSTSNNITLVYDYLVGAWTTEKGYNPTAFAAIQGRNNTKNLFYGTSTGQLNWFGPSFLSDNSAGFTSYLKTRFLHDIGESFQKQFRRLYLNIDQPNATLTFNVNFYQDFGSSVVKSVTILQGSFQTRTDYGISAKALAFDLATIQTNSVLKLHGFTIESRLQRKV
jgi:hypothetical protein